MQNMLYHSLKAVCTFAVHLLAIDCIVTTKVIISPYKIVY